MVASTENNLLLRFFAPLITPSRIVALLCLLISGAVTATIFIVILYSNVSIQQVKNQEQDVLLVTADQRLDDHNLSIGVLESGLKKSQQDIENNQMAIMGLLTDVLEKLE